LALQLRGGAQLAPDAFTFALPAAARDRLNHLDEETEADD
jgi:hypothetical protein